MLVSKEASRATCRAQPPSMPSFRGSDQSDHAYSRSMRYPGENQRRNRQSLMSTANLSNRPNSQNIQSVGEQVHLSVGPKSVAKTFGIFARPCVLTFAATGPTR